MKSKLLAWLAAARAKRAVAARHIKEGLIAFLLPRQALKRGLLVAAMFSVGAVLSLPIFGIAGPWGCAVIIAALFLGLGAERASTSWGAVFSLPAPGDFAFWRWRSPERRRFFASLASLGVCLLVLSLLGAA